MSVDPIGREFPELTPYQFSSNTPIWAIDLDGLEAETATETKIKIDPKLRKESAENIRRENNERERQAKLPTKPYTGTKIPTVVKPIAKSPYFRVLFEFNNIIVNENKRLAEDIQKTQAEIKSLVERKEDFLRDNPVYDDTNPDNKDKRKYVFYVTQRGVKATLKPIFPTVNGSLPYFGITTLIPVGSGGRYPSKSLEGARLNVIFRGLNKTQARGVEQAVIELNNGGEPAPYYNTNIDNLKNSTDPFQKLKYEYRQIVGESYLDVNKPNWRTELDVTTEEFKSTYNGK